MHQKEQNAKDGEGEYKVQYRAWLRYITPTMSNNPENLNREFILGRTSPLLWQSDVGRADCNMAALPLSGVGDALGSR